MAQTASFRAGPPFIVAKNVHIIMHRDTSFQKGEIHDMKESSSTGGGFCALSHLKAALGQTTVRRST